MSSQVLPSLTSLYLQDETAWLDAMAELACEGRTEEMDFPNLAEFLADMAIRDRREVESRLIVLMTHLLKWGFQPELRSSRWRATLIEQRQETDRLVDRGVLRNHALEALVGLYHDSVERAAAETRLPADRFPAECPYTLDQLLTIVVPEVET